jgi:hypothetical protein
MVYNGKVGNHNRQNATDAFQGRLHCFVLTEIQILNNIFYQRDLVALEGRLSNRLGFLSCSYANFSYSA